MASSSLTTFLAGVGSGLVVAVPIGPMGVLCIQRTLAFGLAAGLATGLGAATVHLILGSIAALGLGAALTAQLGAGAQTLLPLLSASLLLWFSVRITSRTAVIGSPVLGGAGWLKAYGSALAIGLANPLTLVLFATCLPALTAFDDPRAVPALVSGVFLGSIAWWIALSTTVSMIRCRLSSRAIALTNKLSGLVLASLGALMFASALGLKVN